MSTTTTASTSTATGTSRPAAGPGPLLVRTREQLATALRAQDAGPAAPSGRRRAVVMTMGALHAGHLALVREARRVADAVVVTIFVNPLQFGAGEDLDRYPRDLEGDLALLSGDGLLGPGDVVLAPTPDVVYPGGDPAVRVSAGPVGEVLEGAARPGHLDGVLTVVLKLMHLTAPDVALFGRKDAQQLAAVRAMVRDLDVPVEVLAVDTQREDDGLARSSRNAYLAPDERVRARALPAALAAGAAAATAGADGPAVVAAARAVLDRALDPVADEVGYVALVDPTSFDPVDAAAAGPGLLLVAARVGGTRLIDNQELVLAGAVAGAATATAAGDGPA
ncbi:pantoate--beta-alanine ligase [Cellulomonas marina]|uniref:Pantothenate synthetase n=1 Tax=Cellulomonas marina TaxID=988821 RepID=A0A1I0WLQ6_9CELL|nr:pantoate--beta-alanine ligase [Cellulomonas marina]GIG27741.1 pantothenate synthetase [Cellulomonas marina]SFA89689.1 pantoate--beta-alanine ligase [Cellulomonas marina]